MQRVALKIEKPHYIDVQGQRLPWLHRPNSLYLETSAYKLIDLAGSSGSLSLTCFLKSSEISQAYRQRKEGSSYVLCVKSLNVRNK